MPTIDPSFRYVWLMGKEKGRESNAEEQEQGVSTNPKQRDNRMEETATTTS